LYGISGSVIFVLFSFAEQNFSPGQHAVKGIAIIKTKILWLIALVMVAKVFKPSGLSIIKRP
jgi:hypothetical protein